MTKLKHKTAAIVWGSEPPAFSIGYEKPMWPGDSGFSVLFDDAPDPDDLPEEDNPEELPPGITLVCLDCLINDHPEIGRGLDIAREYGVADLDESGEWSWATYAASNPAEKPRDLRRPRDLTDGRRD